MQTSATIFDYKDEWRGPLAVSTVLHAALFGSALAWAVVTGRVGDNWGGSAASGDSINATLVSSAIPLPSHEAQKEQVLATENKGLAQSEPEKKQEPEPEATPIPDKTSKAKPAPTPKPKTFQPPKPLETPTNAIPYGESGPVTGHFTTVKTDTGVGGLSVGEGTFGSRYSWYVDAVRRKISDNWLKYEVDPSIHNANRVYVTFEISRTGQVSKVQVSQSSGIPSLDTSAVRALQRIDTFGPLPGDYPGSRVAVEIWFDYKR